jgi:hypothetical protein
MEHTMSRKKQTPSKAFDLSSRYRRDTAVVNILDPVDRTDTGMRIEIGSPQSAEAQAAREQFRSTLTIVGDDVQVSAEDAQASLLAQLVAVTKRWWAEPDSPDGLVIGGEIVACTPDAIRSLYSDPRTSWIYDDVLGGYLNAGSFFGASKAA